MEANATQPMEARSFSCLVHLPSTLFQNVIKAMGWFAQRVWTAGRKPITLSAGQVLLFMTSGFFLSFFAAYIIFAAILNLPENIDNHYKNASRR